MVITSKRPRIIAFAGRKRAGKGMLANGIKDYVGNAEIITIADNLKYLCCELLNVTYKRLIQMKDDGTTFFENVDGRWVTIINAATEISNENICNEIGDKVFTSVREMLQVIGTDLIRKYKPNWHIDKTIERIKEVDENKYVIVDDVRFCNEKEALEAIGANVYFIIHPNCFDVSNHPSEVNLSYDKFYPHKVIINDLPKEDMIEQFNKFYFKEDIDSDDYTDIFLDKNIWYCEHMIDMYTTETNFNVDRNVIIRKVLEQNVNKSQFTKNGIITFHSTNQDMLNLFRRVILNDRRSSDGHTHYSVYNPLTNEILKTYM